LSGEYLKFTRLIMNVDFPYKFNRLKYSADRLSLLFIFLPHAPTDAIIHHLSCHVSHITHKDAEGDMNFGYRATLNQIVNKGCDPVVPKSAHR
jgi:hypothetical protein